MVTKKLKTQLINKHGPESDWKKATNYIPPAGTVVIYEPDDSNPNPRFKIGDGVIDENGNVTGTNVNELPFISVGEAKFEFTKEVNEETGKEEYIIIPKGEIFNDYINNRAESYFTHAEGHDTSASGTASHAEGQGTVADGLASHAEGDTTAATGDYSHTEGSGAFTGMKAESRPAYISNILDSDGNDVTDKIWTELTLGIAAHAEGNSTKAYGDDSHAEGKRTIALVSHTHTEGWGSANINLTPEVLDELAHKFASGNSALINEAKEYILNEWETSKFNMAAFGPAHSEGQNCLALGEAAHAEGVETLAMWRSHSEGSKTRAEGSYSHAEGNTTVASSSSAHAEGQETIAQGNSSHAEGNKTKALSNYAHAEGYYTKASGEASHAEGKETQANSDYSHAEGLLNIAEGFSSHVEGQNTTATGDYSHTEGLGTKAKESCSHAEGNGSQAAGESSHTEGQNTITRGIGAHAEGISSEANGNASHAEGNSTKAKSINSHAEGTSTAAEADSAHAEGISTVASGLASHAEGQNTVASNHEAHAEGFNTAATAAYSHAEGYYTKASGKGAHAEGGTNSDTTGSIASGDYSHAEGDRTVASNLGAHAEGQITNAAGQASHAEGLRAEAIGLGSHAEGYGTAGYTTKAVGNGSHAEGYSTKAYGKYSHTEGQETRTGEIDADGVVTGGTSSHAEGNKTKALGDDSHAEGYDTAAKGVSSHAEGYVTEALGDRSHVEGGWTKSIGMYSHAGGLSSDANGYCSFVHGEGLRTGLEDILDENRWPGDYQVVFGSYNERQPGFYDSGYEPDEVFGFILGNGSGWSERRNAFMVSWSGVTSSVSASVTGADYAEYFEWLDGNPDNEDRRGYFVTLDGDKIRKATASDEYVLGIISGNPGVLGNSSNVGSWNKKYLTDIFDTVIYEQVEIPETTRLINEEENLYEVIPAHIELRPKINPEYDPNKEYKSRSSRPEWSPVGMMGQIVVIDDGSCQVNGYCKATDNGIATSSDKGWRVLERLDDTHIKVLFK